MAFASCATDWSIVFVFGVATFKMQNSNADADGTFAMVCLPMGPFKGDVGCSAHVKDNILFKGTFALIPFRTVLLIVCFKCK